MAAEISFDYELTPDMVGDAVDASLEFMKAGRPDRNIWKGLLAFGLLFVQMTGLLVWLLVEARQAWMIAITAITAIIFGIFTGIFAIAAFGSPISRRQVESAIGKAFQELNTTHVRWTLCADRFHVEPAQKDHLWSDVREAYVGRKFWILHLESQLRLLLPVSALPDGAERYILDRLTNAGAELRIEKAA